MEEQEPTMVSPAALAETGAVDIEPTAWSDTDEIEEPEPYDDSGRRNWLISGVIFAATAAIAGLVALGAYIFLGQDQKPATPTVSPSTTTITAQPDHSKVAVADPKSPVDDAYLADVFSQGIPVSDVNRGSLIQMGQATCVTYRDNPSMQIVDLAMTIAEKRTAYPYDKARIIVTAALEHYCPKPAPAQPAVYDQKFLSKMRGLGWTVTDADGMTHNARQSCFLLAQGNTVQFVQQSLSTETNTPLDQAVEFVRTAMAIYPDCP
ncbi:DUF732 domain-containing protein [Mycobacteroides franklinii]|uniref:DUF732 domain-containing protein n=1 Tax=Mycobacteroides franklinii TaxID=948102 RepID=UPI000992A93C|nr:DUF732 domain-containing protein [Mycobacteroides franklinii]